MAPLYFIEVKTERLGRWFLEADRDQNGRKMAIEAARDSRHQLVKVLEVFEDEGTVRDITSDIIEEAEQLEVA